MPSLKLTISEAAKLVGVDALTIRRALKKNEIRHLVIAGRYKIDLADLLVWVRTKSSVVKKMTEHGSQFVEKWKI